MCKEAKSNFILGDFEMAEMKNTDVQIKVTHNGICHTDVHMRDNDWGITKFPLVAGHEIIGNVTHVGADVKDLLVGDRVGVGWIKDSCGDCRNCHDQRENVCHNY